MRKTVKLRIQRGKHGQAISYTVTLPKDYVEALGWEPGEKLEVALDTEKREIRIRRPAP